MHRLSRLPRPIVLGALLGAFVLAAGLLRLSRPSITSAQAPDITGPLVSAPLRGTAFHGDLRRLPQTPPKVQDRLFPAPRRPRKASPGVANASRPDVVRQQAAAPFAMPLPIQNFKGLDRVAGGDGWPPDPNGDVGPNHYIQTVNTSIGIFDKSGNRLAAIRFNDFFTGTATLCDTNNYGDPIAVYDALSGRWILSDFAFALDGSGTPVGPFYECLAVSMTGDPVSGGWWFYPLLADNSLLNDYPKLGVWSDGIYMSANMLAFSPFEYQATTRVWALDRAGLIGGTLRSVSFDVGSFLNPYPSLLPGNLRGALPPVGTPNVFASVSVPLFGSNDTLELWKFHVDWAVPSNSTFTGPANLTIAAWSEPNPIPELNGNSLDTLGDRLMMQNQYRNRNGVQSLYLTHSVASSGVSGIRWYEVRDPAGAPSLYQQSTFQPDLTHRWMGSIAADRMGNLAVGYSVSSASMYPAIRYAGRLVSDPLNQLGQGEQSLTDGTGAQANNCGGAPCTRWGDYSAMSVDPVDDCTFWYTNEYYEASGGNWQTRIGAFKFPGCFPAMNPLMFPVMLNDAN